MALPTFIVIQRSGLVRFVREEEANHGFLQFRTDDVADPCVKLEVERSNAGNGLVHLRSCYNNKYFRIDSLRSTWIVAAADEAEEDSSIWSCTLFEPVPSTTSSGQLRCEFKHVQLGRWVGVRRYSGIEYPNCLAVNISRTTFTIIDWETLVFLPKHVAFKGDNGRYLRTRLINGRQHLQFGSNDKADPTVRFEVIDVISGSIRMKSHHLGTLWRRLGSTPNWILANGGDSGTVFLPIRIGTNVIGLGTDLNNRGPFCQRFSSSGITDCLSASSSTLVRTTRMEVAEVVLSRRIDNVVYNLNDARIYNGRTIIVKRDQFSNQTSVTDYFSPYIEYEETQTTTWNATVSATLAVNFTFRFGIPVIAGKEITISAEITAEYQWGKTTETKKTMGTKANVEVPPNSTAIVSMVGTEASFDIPFTYVQRDTLLDGSQVVYEKVDGLFVGINGYDFHTEVQNVPHN